MFKKNCKIRSCISGLTNRLFTLFDGLAPLANASVFLALRLWIAIIFWQSGLTKIASWESTLFLFEEEYQVPFLPVSVAAFLATAMEIIIPVLLVIGLGTRFAVIPLLIMAAVIQFTYMESHTHFIWALVLLAIMINGAGLFSWDNFIKNKALNQSVDSKLIGLISSFITISLSIIAAHELLAAFTEIEPWLDDMLECFKEIGKD